MNDNFFYYNDTFVDIDGLKARGACINYIIMYIKLRYIITNYIFIFSTIRLETIFFYNVKVFNSLL